MRRWLNISYLPVAIGAVLLIIPWFYLSWNTTLGELIPAMRFRTKIDHRRRGAGRLRHVFAPFRAHRPLPAVDLARGRRALAAVQAGDPLEEPDLLHAARHGGLRPRGGRPAPRVAGDDLSRRVLRARRRHLPDEGGGLGRAHPHAAGRPAGPRQAVRLCHHAVQGGAVPAIHPRRLQMSRGLRGQGQQARGVGCRADQPRGALRGWRVAVAGGAREVRHRHVPARRHPLEQAGGGARHPGRHRRGERAARLAAADAVHLRRGRFPTSRTPRTATCSTS